MPLTITHTWPMLGIQTQNAKLNLSNNGATDFKISHTEPQIQIQTTQPKLHIDQTKAFGDEGLKNIQDLMDQFASDGKQAVLSYIANKVDEGKRLGSIEDGGNAIAEIARDSQFVQKDFGLGIMPAHAPEINVEEGQVKFDLARGEVNTEYNPVPIDTNFIPPEIKIYMIQNGDLNIEYTGNSIDTKV